MRFEQTELSKVAFEMEGPPSGPPFSCSTVGRTRQQGGSTLPRRCKSYHELQARLKKTVLIEVPTLMMQGASDFCDLPSASDGQEKYFPNGYERILLQGVGHFPHREAPAAVAGAALRLLSLVK
jgi:pimeloyl-ACP methyl ester carboxylesterase